MVLIMEPFSCSDEIGYSPALLFDRSFFVMICDQINIVSQSEGAAPKKEPVDPPAYCISVLF